MRKNTPPLSYNSPVLAKTYYTNGIRSSPEIINGAVGERRPIQKNYNKNTRQSLERVMWYLKISCFLAAFNNTLKYPVLTRNTYHTSNWYRYTMPMIDSTAAQPKTTNTGKYSVHARVHPITDIVETVSFAPRVRWNRTKSWYALSEKNKRVTQKTVGTISRSLFYLGISKAVKYLEIFNGRQLSLERHFNGRQTPTDF